MAQLKPDSHDSWSLRHLIQRNEVVSFNVPSAFEWSHWAGTRPRSESFTDPWRSWNYPFNPQAILRKVSLIWRVQSLAEYSPSSNTPKFIPSSKIHWPAEIFEMAQNRVVSELQIRSSFIRVSVDVGTCSLTTFLPRSARLVLKLCFLWNLGRFEIFCGLHIMPNYFPGICDCFNSLSFLISVYWNLICELRAAALTG